MSNIVLLAETGSDLPKDVAERYGVFLVPMHVSMGDVTLDDGAFPVEQICDYYTETQKLPKTSGCSPEDFNKIFDGIHKKWPEKHILHLAYSAVTTCSYQSAIIAAEGRDYVTSIDTKKVSVGQSAIIYQTARLLERYPDISLAETIKEVKDFCDRARMCFVPDDLEYLKAGGRVSNAVYLGGRVLSIRPVIELENGYLVAKKKYRGKMERVAMNLLQEFSQTQQLEKDHLWLIRSIGLSEEVQMKAEKMAKEYGYREITWIQTGCVITTHGGPGAFGVVGFSTKNEEVLYGV